MNESDELSYERCEDDSYAFLTVCDGPDDDSGFPAPVEPPPTDPKNYSLDPCAFGKSVGLDPTRTIRRGDRKRWNGRYFTRNVWELRSSLPRDAAPHEHVKNVLQQLKPSLERFIEASHNYIVVMHVVSKGTNPGLVLDRTLIERLATIRAGIDGDMYPADADGADD